MDHIHTIPDYFLPLYCTKFCKREEHEYNFGLRIHTWSLWDLGVVVGTVTGASRGAINIISKYLFIFMNIKALQMEALRSQAHSKSTCSNLE